MCPGFPDSVHTQAGPSGLHLPWVVRINLTVPQGCLLAVVGPVGAGKSSLLSALLGELLKVEGSVSIEVRPPLSLPTLAANMPHILPEQLRSLPPTASAPTLSTQLPHSHMNHQQRGIFQGSVAYVPQEAWVQNTSVVENVCFRQELDLPWLQKVLEACALGSDVASFPAGVHTPIGEQVRSPWGHRPPCPEGSKMGTNRDSRGNIWAKTPAIHRSRNQCVQLLKGAHSHL